jgi:hypothetical protein
MIKLKKGNYSNIGVNPRWPQKFVLIHPDALSAVEKAQSTLPSSISLVITRAFQPQGVLLRIMRLIGALVFMVIYSHRKNEVKEIFGHNGHATNGKHIDIGIIYKGQELKMLPQSVFSSLKTISEINTTYGDILAIVQQALKTSGFEIHRNQTEALQIHCDYLSK